MNSTMNSNEFFYWPKALPQHLAIFCSFDEVVSPLNSMESILLRFGTKGWRRFWRKLPDSGENLRDCLAKQIALIRATREDLDAFLDTVPLRKGFKEFMAFCRRNEVDFTIISEGPDYVVHRILAGHILYALPVIANRLLFQDQDRYGITFPHSAVDCTLSVCKCNAAMEKNWPIILIGGGSVDFCLTGLAALVLAVEGSPLHLYCEQNQVQHLTFKDFFEARDILAGLLPEITGDSLRPYGKSRSGIHWKSRVEVLE